MNIFHKRPLCLILCIGLCGFFLFSLEIDFLRILLPVIGILLGFISIVFKFSKYNRAILKSISVIIILSSILSYVYFDTYFKAYDIYNERVEVVGTVSGVSESSSYTTRLLVNVEQINGKAKGGYKFYAYTKKNDAKGVVEGTRISFDAILEGFSAESKTSNIANGINAYASDVTNLNIIEYTNGGLHGIFS